MLKYVTLSCFGGLAFRRGHVWLCIGPAPLRGLDYGMTLYGQPAAYWAGDYLCAREGNNWLRWCLQHDPLFFVASGTLATAAYSLLVLFWPQKPARAVVAVQMLAHAYGACTWVWRAPILGPAACVGIVYFCWYVMRGLWEKQEHVDSTTDPAPLLA